MENEITEKVYSTLREKCLSKATKCVCGTRESDYGNPKTNFEHVAKLWSAYLDKDISATDVSMLMALFKAARIKSGRGTEDSFIDMAGYVSLAMEIDKTK